MKDYYTVQDLAKALKLNICTIYHHIKAGYLTTVKAGRLIRIKHTDAVKWAALYHPNKKLNLEGKA